MDWKLSHAEEIVGNAFGMSAFALWGNLCGYHPELTLLEQKTAFFELVGTLLAEGQVRFVKPDADVYASPNHVSSKTVNDVETHWIGAHSEIIACLERKWPSAVSSWDDVELAFYLYEIPAIIWRNEDGSWCGS